MVILRVLAFLLFATAARAEGEVRLSILHDHAAHVVSEMILLTIRGEYDRIVTLESLTFPDSPDYDWVQIARDDWHKQRIKGREWQIFERKVAIFPRRPGAVTVPALTHHLTVDDGPFQRPQITVTSAPLTLDILPFPGGHRPLAASHLTIEDALSADPGKLRDGEVLTRRVTITAEGTLAHLLPARPEITEPWLISFTAPEERVTRLTPEGPVARVVWEWQLRPRTGEPGVLPAAAFPWFDTVSRQVEVAPLKPIPFGFASFGSNFQTGGPAPAVTLGMSLILFGAGATVAVATLLHGRRIAGAEVIAWRWRRLRPSPHLRAMRAAARAGDLAALRGHALRHLALRGRAPDPAVMAPLDRQLYGPAPAPDFDARRWLAAFRRAARGAS